jgi:hypothetical protein
MSWVDGRGTRMDETRREAGRGRKGRMSFDDILSEKQGERSWIRGKKTHLEKIPIVLLYDRCEGGLGGRCLLGRGWRRSSYVHRSSIFLQLQVLIDQRYAMLLHDIDSMDMIDPYSADTRSDLSKLSNAKSRSTSSSELVRSQVWTSGKEQCVIDISLLRTTNKPGATRRPLSSSSTQAQPFF